MTGSHRHHRRVGNGMRTALYRGPGLPPPGSRTTSAGAEPPRERSERSFWSTPAQTPNPGATRTFSPTDLSEDPKVNCPNPSGQKSANFVGLRFQYEGTAGVAGTTG